LLDASRLFNSAADVGTVLHAIIKLLSRTSLDMSSIQLFEGLPGRPSGCVFHVADSSKQHDVEELYRAMNLPLSRTESFLGPIMLRGEPLLMDRAKLEAVTHPGTRKWVELLHVESFLAVPIIGKDAVLGTLNSSSSNPEIAFTSDDLWFWTQLAAHAAVVIEHSRALGIIEAQSSELRRLLTEHVEAQERERQRIALDVHDSVLQSLIAALQGVRGLNVHDVDRQRSIEAQLRSSIDELRSIVGNLRPVSLDTLGLAHAVEVALHEFENQELIVTHFDLSGAPVRITDLAEVTLYRIFQEALSNVRKHAQASSVEVLLTFTPEQVEIEISDDGVGVAATTIPGFGLSGMKERAMAAGGLVTVEPRLGGGTTVRACIPSVSLQDLVR
jgi:signal transduction histidine kinase